MRETDGAREEPVDGLRAELQEERDRHLRTRAEFENYKRRVGREREGASRQSKRGLLLALVDLADGFDRALAHVDESGRGYLWHPELLRPARVRVAEVSRPRRV